MTTIRIMAEGAHAEVISMTGTLTSGMVGAITEFHYGPEWDGLLKTAVFTAGSITRDVVDAGDVVEVPHEVLVKPGEFLRVGVYGYRADGTVVIPTVMVYVGKIMPGADPSGDVSAQPTPTLVQQMMGLTQRSVEASEAAAEDAQAAVNAAEQSAGESAQARQAAQETAKNVVDANQFAEDAQKSASEAAAIAENLRQYAEEKDESMKSMVSLAGTKATDASGSASEAARSASQAAQSETNAKASEQNAKTSETAAENAKTTAEQKAVAAATSAANAAKSEGNAKTSETNAQAAETDAQAAQVKAEEAAANAETWAKSVHLPQVAKPGQTIIVKTVEDKGIPTEWEAVDYQEKICGSEPGVEVLNHTITNDQASMMLSNRIGLVAGKEYIVTVNGTETTCLAEEQEDEGLTFVTLTTPEFMIMDYSPEAASAAGYGAYLYPYAFNGEPPVAVSIRTAETIQTIPPKYLPEGVPYFETVELLPETTLAVSEMQASTPADFTFEVGTTYKVVWNGTTYVATGYESGLGTVVIGDATALGLHNPNANGEPFFMVATNGQLALYATDGSETITVSITGEIPKKIDKVLLPAHSVGILVGREIFGIDYEVPDSPYDSYAEAWYNGAMLYLWTEDEQGTIRVYPTAIEFVIGTGLIIHYMWNGSPYKITLPKGTWTPPTT